MSSGRQNPNYEQGFKTGIDRFGVDFLMMINERCLKKYDLDSDERKALFNAVSYMKKFGMQSPENLRGLRLNSFLDFGLSKYSYIVHYIETEIMKILSTNQSINRMQIRIPAEEDRRVSQAYTVETNISEEYDDDFDVEDVDDEAIAVVDDSDSTKFKVASSKKNHHPWKRESSPIHEEDEDYLQRADSVEEDVLQSSKQGDDDSELLLIASDKHSNHHLKPFFPPKPSIVEPTPTRVSPPKPLSAQTPTTAKTSTATAPSSGSSNVALIEEESSRISRSVNRKRSKAVTWIKEKKWILGDKIGHGSFGEVFQGMNKETGQLFACKALHVAGKESEVEKLAEEIDLMRGLSHPNIVTYLGAFVDEEKAVVYIFLDWVPGGSVAHLLKKFGPFDEEVVRNFTRQILHGLKYLHENNIVHRDIKGGNVLVDDGGKVKLADFGASRKNDFEGTQATSTIRGTPYFMAPEVLADNHYGRKGDIWAVGCTMIQMLTGNPPWKDFSLNNLIQLHVLLSTWSKGPPPCDAKISDECRECLNFCFIKNEAQRPYTHELLACSFLVEDALEDSMISSNNTSLVESPQRTSKRVNETKDDDPEFNAGGTMFGLREQLGRVISRASLVFDGEDTIHRIDRTRKEREDRVSRPTPSPPVSSSVRSSAANPYKSGATHISQEIIAKAAASEPRPVVNTNFRSLIPTRSPEQNVRLVSTQLDGARRLPPRNDSASQGTQRDSEVTPMSDAEVEPSEEDLHAELKAMKPFPKNSSPGDPSLTRGNSSSAIKSNLSARTAAKTSTGRGASQSRLQTASAARLPPSSSRTRASPTVARINSGASEEERSVVWTCARCFHENTNKDYIDYCQFCARGRHPSVGIQR